MSSADQLGFAVRRSRHSGSDRPRQAKALRMTTSPSIPTTLTRVEQYKLLTGAVVPRPIALVTTLGVHGVNAAPFSFFNAVAAEPPMIMFSAGRRSNGIKDTTRNIQETREFVVHIVDDAAREKMNICGIEYGLGVNEVHEAGFRTAPSVRVRPPRLIDCPVQLECRAIDIITFGHYDMIIGEVVFLSLSRRRHQRTHAHRRREAQSDWPPVRDWLRERDGTDQHAPTSGAARKGRRDNCGLGTGDQTAERSYGQCGVRWNAGQHGIWCNGRRAIPRPGNARPDTPGPGRWRQTLDVCQAQ